MAKRKGNPKVIKPVSLLILEGETEVLFYQRIRDDYLKGIRVELRNMKGQGNTNKDVLAEMFKYCRNNPSDLVHAYCCLDTEKQTQSATPLDIDLVLSKIKSTPQLANVLNVTAILADPHIESWFFYDIAGIYGFLHTTRTQRNLRKYANPKGFGKKDLMRLFQADGRFYLPGKKAETFINNLDVDRIVTNCKELSDGIASIKKNAMITK